MSAAEARAAITESAERLGVAETVLGGVDPGATLPRRDATETSPARLPDLAVAAEPEESTTEGLPPASTDFVTRGVLGRGGMGVVRLALQRSLERDVAVKTSGKTDRAMRTLVREARITGGLEHPNVVPVHALGLDREGAPVLVMKRVEGVAWRTLIQEPSHEAWGTLLAGHGDPMRAHIEILAQVTRALVFAHDRGVVHRDVKPQNVMIGRFGEVYLLDWGVALRLDERSTEPSGIVGTPGYLAPEMARGDPKLVGTHTDVYLLGATLYEVLTGKPPHDAPNALAALVDALVGEPPTFDDDAPRELVQLVLGAMARDPADRPPSAEAFREGLARFLVSREAERVREEGRKALARAEAAIARNGAASLEGFRALIEARFALSSSQRARLESGADPELERCITHLVEREIALRSPVGARALLSEMTRRPDGIEERLAALEAALEVERSAAAERERARRDRDSSLSLQAMLGIVMTIVSLTVLVVGFLVVENDGETHMPGTTALLIWQIPIGAFAVLGVVRRKQIMANATTRGLAAFLALALLTPFFITAAGVFVGLNEAQRSGFSWIALVGIILVGEFLILPRVWPSALVCAMGVVVILAYPDAFLWVQAFVILTMAAFFVRSLLLHARESRVKDDDEVGPRGSGPGPPPDPR